METDRMCAMNERACGVRNGLIGRFDGVVRRVCGGLVVGVVMLGAAGPVFGQALPDVDLDEGEFIRGLRERGMTELLSYHLDANPPADALRERVIRIEVAKGEFEDPTRGAAERAAAADRVLELYRDLIAQAPARHHQLPLWRTQMVEFILRAALPVRHMNAGEFVEFGLPTPDMREAFDKLAVEAYEQAEQAYLDAFELQGDLPRRDEFQREYVNTGFWRTLNEEYFERRIPFAYGWAAYYATLASEPSGSLDEALEQFGRIDLESLNARGRAELRSLLGRTLVAAERYGEAQEHLDRVPALLGGNGVSGHGLWARLAWVHALAGADRDSAAVELVQEILEDFREQEAVGPLMVVMVHDAWYRVTEDYEIFERLFEDPLVADHQEQVRSFVVSRLAAEPKTPEQLREEPPLVVLAHADVMLDRAVEERENGNASAARLQFDNVEQVLGELIERPNLEEEMEARARFRLGSAEYRRQRPADAVRAWVELGRKLPNYEEGRNATINAFSVAHSLYRERPENTNVVELFDEASHTLLEYQEGHPVAEQHTYTRAAFLRAQRRYDEAITAYYQVGTEHPYYADALYEVAVIHHTRWLGAESDERARLARQGLEAVDAALEVFARKTPIERESLRRKFGDALLLKAELQLQQLGEAALAAQTLSEFSEGDFEGFDELEQRYQRLRVNVAVAQGRFEEARERVQGFAERGLAEGGALIQHALRSVTERAGRLRERGQEEEADALDALSVDLAQDLVDWADRQEAYREDPRQRLPLELILARQQRAAGELDASRALLESLYERQYGTSDDGEPVTGADQLEVLYELARTAMAQGDHERARPVINRILNLHPTKDGRTWWDSWRMSLAILDDRYDELVESGEEAEAERMSERIHGYLARLRHSDDDFGGGAWQREFERLARRHQQ